MTKMENLNDDIRKWVVGGIITRQEPTNRD